METLLRKHRPQVLIKERLRQMPHLRQDAICLLDVRVDSLSLQELFDAILCTVQEHRKAVISSINIHGMNLAYELSWLHDFYNDSERIICDGHGIVLAAHLLGKEMKPRITYADMMWHLAEFSEADQLSAYFLGGKPGVAEKAAIRLKEKYPRLQIVGTHHGYFDKSPQSAENRAIIADINNHKPNILVLGFGMPLQEHWLVDNWNNIDANVVLTGGSVFDYVAGSTRRAPRWMTDHGFEWLGRLIIEPRRLWKRYIIGNPLFFWRLFMHEVIGMPLYKDR